MQTRTTLSILILGLGAGLLWLAATRNAPLLELRQRQAPGHGTVLADAPPVATFTTIALGGFRGLLADVLWLRTARLQEEGRYFELVQLSDWITKLEPHCAEIWRYHAWNMAYNVSVTIPDPAERWRWVENGIRLLRDEGLPINPTEPTLYFELGWIFQNKIGGITDNANRYYKARWAMAMTELLGDGFPDYERLAADTQRTARMRKGYGLQPEVMREIDERYGPLDWRSPYTHSLYWAYLGRRVATGHERTTCQRMIYQSLAALFDSGALVFEPDRQLFIMAPQLDLLDHVCRAYEEAIQSDGLDAIGPVYAGFMKRAVTTLHLFGREQEAQQLFHDLHDRFPDSETRRGFDGFIEERTAEEAQGAP